MAMKPSEIIIEHSDTTYKLLNVVQVYIVYQPDRADYDFDDATLYEHIGSYDAKVDDDTPNLENLKVLDMLAKTYEAEKENLRHQYIMQYEMGRVRIYKSLDLTFDDVETNPIDNVYVLNNWMVVDLETYYDIIANSPAVRVRLRKRFQDLHDEEDEDWEMEMFEPEDTSDSPPPKIIRVESPEHFEIYED